MRLRLFSLRFIALTSVFFVLSLNMSLAASGIVVAFGASQTEGYGVSPSEAYPAQLEAMLRAKGHNVKVINAGHNGETTDLMLARLDSDVPDGTKVVILQPGNNDERNGNLFRIIDHLKNVTELKRRLSARKIAVVTFEKSDIFGLPLQPDGLHFTAGGYHLLAQRLVPKVLAAMRN